MEKLRKRCKPLSERPFCLYTICFALCFAAVFGPFFLSHKTFVYHADSIAQHYPSFLYYGEKLRQIFTGLFQGKGLQFPQWEYSIGLGADVFATLSYYIIGEPLSLLSILFPASAAPYGYSLMIALRLYFAGLAFCAFLKERDSAPWPIVLAALAYVFAGYGLRPAIFHSPFSIPMMDLPLLLWGTERLYRKKDPKIFILAVFHSAVSSFYFFYMLVILVILYAALRYFSLFPGKPLSDLGRWVLRFFLAALAGTALAAPILLPCLNSVLSSDRLLAVDQNLLYYPGTFYSHYAAGLLTVYESYYFYVALSGPVIVGALLILTAPRGQFREEKLAMAALFLFTLVPFFGSMFNAFTYITNRWIWAYIAGICFCFARSFTILKQLTRKQLILTACLLVLLTLLSLLPAPREKALFLQLSLLWGSYFVILLCNTRWQGKALALLTAAGILITGAGLFWPGNSENYSGYLNRTQAVSRYRGEIEEMMANAGLDPDYRGDSAVSQSYNHALTSGRGTTSYYYSLIDPGTAQFQNAVYYNRPYGQTYYGPRQQSMLASLLGVRYFAIEAGKTDTLPYGFDTLVATNGSYEVYESENALPLVTLYDGVASIEEAPSPFALQQLMLQAAVTDEETSLPHAEVALTVEEIPYTWNLETCQDASAGEGYITAQKDGGWVELSFEPVEGKELCVVFDGLKGNLDDPDRYNRIEITASCGNVSNLLWTVQPTNNFYCGYENFLISAGYHETEQNQIRLKLGLAGTYTFDNLRIYGVDPSFLEDTTAKLLTNGAQNILRETNRISFSTQRDEPCMAFISIPYNENWSVTVDGEPAKLRNIQSGLCGVELPAGEHQVVMTYRCRPFWIGAAISGVTAVILLTYFLLPKKKK